MAASGKRTTRAIYWQNVSDGFFTTASVGAIAVAESDPNVIYAGMGEVCTHPDIEGGDGVYKSTDAGKTWTNVGLKESEHIGAIVIHPRDPDMVYVAALGHHYGFNPERGVYRSKDGGKTWKRVLFKSDKAGAVDLSMDPSNPDVIYASIYQLLRQPWSEPSGGPDSGFYKSTDGGDTWTEISRNPGLPKGELGKIGLAISRSRPNRVYALIEAADGGIFRSEDAGATWSLINNQRDFRFLASSYTHIIADPKNPDTIYLPWMELFKSTDGGKTIVSLPMPHSDHHALWIDPENPKRMIEGSDGGAIVTINGGKSWSSQYNQPTGEFYHVNVDTQFPYRVYGTQMDNSAISVPSRTHDAAIEWKDVTPSAPPKAATSWCARTIRISSSRGPSAAPAAAAGICCVYDRRTGQQQLITVWPEDQYGSPVKDVKYRFHFTYPVLLSPQDPNVLYVAANKVFRSSTQGSSWEVISPDLTKNDLSKMQEIDGGPITSQGFSSQYSSVIFALAASRLKRGELWAGSDDGSIHLSRDDGKTWQNVSPKDLPEWTNVSTIDVSPHDPGTAYIAANRHELDDQRPYVLKTTDYGQTWQHIENGVGPRDFPRVIREDTVRKGLLYLGTETGVYVSFNAGASWQSLRFNLPAVPVHDLVVKDNDLVAGTHGRAFWILDDLTPLREMTREVTEAPAHLFKVLPTYRLLGGRGSGGGGGGPASGPDYLRISGDGIALHETRRADGTVARTYLNAGNNPAAGVVVTYYLKQKPEDDVSLTFLDANNQVIRQLSSAGSEGGGPGVPAAPGTNRFVWDMTYPGAREIPPGQFLPLEWARAQLPVAPPGRYKVRLHAGGRDYEQTFEIRKDPRVSATEQDLRAQFALMLQVRDKLSQVTDAVNEVRKVRGEVAQAAKRMGVGSGAQAATEAAAKLDARLVEIEGTLTRLLGPNPMRVPPKTLNIRLATLTAVVQSSDEAPPRQAYDVFEDLAGRADAQLTELKNLKEREISEFMKMVAAAGR